MSSIVLGIGVETETTTFAFDTASPIDFGSLVAGDQILESEVVIDTVFDDAAALLALGQVSDPGNILPTNQINAQVTGTYANAENFLVAGADQLRLQITPFASTQGSGRVVVRIRRA